MERILLVCTLVVCLLQGSSAVTPVFVKKGDDLLLNVTEDVPEDFSIVAWKFREKIVVTFFNQGKPTVSGAYTGRVETSMKNFSVKLKNLQEADSGVYTAQVIAEVQQTLEYNVTVQAPVSPVGLTVDSVSNSSDSCNLTVTCSTQDSHISSTLRCDTQTCSQEGGERSEVTTSGASLHVYLVNGSIICNHSNQVSWTTNMTNIQDFCPQHVGFKPSRNHVITYVTATVGVLAVILSITAGVFKFRQRGTGKSKCAF
ncbi:CD48 antigen-like isoform X2 [Larimichthys crocea]|uniref:CD48 antigen-like isoform X2 n=1 Tax=Larimichthys crocea TaxID=215358 RepID=UPI000F5DF87C|nr:CD48 antigen-like isoform X2 [Larimichthys crocea]